jgi:hypothetical protein
MNQEKNEEQKSILDMVQGGVTEIINENVAEILMNIQNPNTDLKKRELVIKVTLSPVDDRRKKINVTYNTTPKLRPINPIATSIYAGIDENGQLTAMELMEHIPGQVKLEGGEEPQPVIINFSKIASK